VPPVSDHFIGTVGGELVCHILTAPMFGAKAYRATRLVVMPEWQGAGVGTKFLEWVCEYHKGGMGRLGRKYPTFFHTSHPQLIGFLNYSKRWVLKSQQMFGGDKARSGASLKRSSDKKGGRGIAGGGGSGTGFGGHFRAVQGFKYIGDKLK
jgi:GNAT superfamily N-acetyltransferase